MTPLEIRLILLLIIPILLGFIVASIKFFINNYNINKKRLYRRICVCDIDIESLEKIVKKLG